MRLVVSQQGQLKARTSLTCGSQTGCSSLQVLLRLPAALIHRKGLLWWVFKRVFVWKWSNFHQTKSTSLKPPPRHVCVSVSSPQYTMLTDIKKSSSSPLGVEATGRKWIDGPLNILTTGGKFAKMPVPHPFPLPDTTSTHIISLLKYSKWYT